MKGKIFIIAAILLGLTTSFMVYGYLKNVKKSIDNVEYVQIIVAKKSITQNSKLDESMVGVKTIPLKYKHKNEVTDKKDVIGKIALIPIAAGESIMSNQLTQQGESNNGLAYMIPLGRRAMSVAIDAVSGIAGEIKVRDHVDVITTIPIGENPPIPYTLLVLQDIEVLAVGNKIDDKKKEDSNKTEEIKTITLAVTLEESLKLKMASQRGAISLLLRSPIDKTKGNPLPFKAEDFAR